MRYIYLIFIKPYAYRAKLSQSDTLTSLAHLQLGQSQIYICMKHIYVAYKLLNIEQERHFCMLQSMLQRYGTRVSSNLERFERAEHEALLDEHARLEANPESVTHGRSILR